MSSGRCDARRDDAEPRGISLCLELRRNTDVPILFISAKKEPPDRVVGLRVGADDYIGKPFDNDELLARIEALLRRAQISHDGAGAKQMRFGRFVIDSGSVQAIAGDRQVQLTPTEFKLLRTLAGEPGRVFTRDDLLTGVWGYEPGSDTRLVDVHVGRLRKKLEDATVTEVTIETRAARHRLETPPERVTSPAHGVARRRASAEHLTCTPTDAGGDALP